MLVDGKHVNAGPRMDGGPKAFKPENALTSLKYDHDTEMYTLTINDTANPEFRVVVIINQNELDAAKEA